MEYKKQRKVSSLPAKDWNIWDVLKTVFLAAPLWSVVLLLLQVFEALLPTVFLFATAGFVDTAIAVLNKSVDYNTIFSPLIYMLVTASIENCIYTVEWFVNEKFYANVKLYVEEMFIAKKASIKYQYIESADTKDLMKRVCGDPGVNMCYRAERVLYVIYDVVQIASIFTVILVRVWWSGLVSMLISVPIIWVAVKNALMQYQTYKDTQKIERYADQYHQMLRHKDFLEERTTFGYTEYVIDRWFGKRRAADEANLKTSLKASGRENSMSVLSNIMAIGIILSLVYPVADGSITPGMFVALINASMNLASVMTNNVYYRINGFVRMKRELEDLSRFTKLEDEPGSLDEPRDMSSVGIQSIEFRNVSFMYPETDRYILKNCSFTLQGKEHYAFVGVNGAGKTTITKLLTRLYDNYEGDIFINGKNLRDYEYSEIKGFFAVVHQDFARYQIELAENIKLGDVNKDDIERVRQAISDIKLDDAVEKLHSGLDTPLGKTFENGVDLSGGEWQRVAIARNLYSDAPMKILDEPTAALDPIAESGIYELFRKITMNKSAIFITHRLGAAKIADKILVVDQGRVTEFGSHKELIEKNGLYAEMFNTQKGWYE